MNKFVQFGFANPIPIVKPVIERKIYNVNGFYVSIADHVYDKESTELIFKSTCTDVLNRYLQNINTYRVKDQEITKDVFDIIQYDFENTRLLRRFRRRYPDTDCMFRLESDRYVFWVLMKKSISVSSEYNGTLCFVDKQRRFAAIGTSSIDTSSYDNSDRKIMLRSAFQNQYLFITSFKDKIGNKITVSNSDTMEIEQGFTLAINTGLHKIIDGDFDPSKFGGSIPTHNDYEMLVYHKIIGMFSIKNLICPLNEYINQDSVREEDIHIGYRHIPEYFGMGNSFKNFPLIQLNEKEIQFISNYANKNAYQNGQLDLPKYLMNPRYGDTMRFNIAGRGSILNDVIISYKIEEDDISFSISHYIPDKFTYAILVYFSGIKEFNIAKCHVANAHFLYMPNVDSMPTNLTDLDNVVIASYSVKDILELIKRFIEICIAIHDRPERTKMIKCVSKEYYVKKESNPHIDEKDYIVSRILKTKTDAREYIERMSGTRAECEYSVEEWDRVGHYRTLKSGKTIWIRETTCKRHLPLSEKEVRIKL